MGSLPQQGAKEQIQDTVSLVEYHKETAEDIQVVLHHNGTCLGTALQILNTGRAGSFLPGISVGGNVRVETRVLLKCPKKKLHARQRTYPAIHSLDA